ncbi:MAG: G5 domain-containing protein [Clostridium argentinense]|uniref:G5 domain-containing protein n=1 Tax=Clostridium faecium TaxID=2762223 RepID=A0ABR8YVE4_9CLOT|nr:MULTISPECIES: 3D domain-containing protein [Clostridium]MBD8048195.1 G5 domain-containing protein [Clostridium faecium]MBS5824963.1 G5 domain-containing protein [Clostridium argentinense]MDU1348627.1 3D domain-containing protein [Clostridium argentinense]
MIMNARLRLNNYFSTWQKALFIVMLVLLAITITIINMRKTISIVIDGQEVQVTTLSNKLDKILENEGIVVSKFDKVSVALDSEVKDGDNIYINKAVDVEVNVDGKVLKIKSAEDSVEKMLKAENITLGKFDKITPEQSKLLQNGLKVQITRVNKKIEDEVKHLDFATEVRKNDDLPQGTQNIVQKGEKGEKLITTEIVYEDGKEISRKVLKEKLKKKPISQIVDVGTLGVLKPSRGGEDYYTEVLTMSSTAYTADRGDDNGVAAMGVNCVRDPDGYSTIAVDPRIIPLGTKVYVEGYGYAIAQDTGGAIKGNIIDLYFNTYNEMINWGRRTVNVYILK